jgi:MFS family permease
MTSFEIKSTLGIAFIYILRMLGLFIVLPIMSLHLTDLSEYSSTFMIGLAFGMYGLTQALFQIPFGILSDKFGRKKMILLGLFIFLVGSIFIYFSQSLIMIIIGRGLQGAGAISAVLLALLADLTTDSARTKSMAIIGASIGLTFGISIVLSPILNSYLGFENIFLMIAILTLIAMGVLIRYIPAPINLAKNKDNKVSFKQVIFDKVFLKLDLGIFSLHASQIIMFMMIPVMLNNIGYPIKYHWQIYLPVFVLSILAIVPMILLSSKKQMLKTFFLGSIILLILVQYLFIYWSDNKQNIMIILLMYFVGFNFLEATLPSLISRLSPKNLKGLVLGAYNTSQSLGIFMGGILGGFIASRYGNQAIFIVSALFLLIWLFTMIKFIFPANRKDLVLKINPKFFLLPQNLTDDIYKKINRLEFVEETLIFPSESYIIIKSKNDLTLDQKKIIKVLGEKYAIS